MLRLTTAALALTLVFFAIGCKADTKNDFEFSSEIDFSSQDISNCPRIKDRLVRIFELLPDTSYLKIDEEEFNLTNTSVGDYSVLVFTTSPDSLIEFYHGNGNYVMRVNGQYECDDKLADEMLKILQKYYSD